MGPGATAQAESRTATPGRKACRGTRRGCCHRLVAHTRVGSSHASPPQLDRSIQYDGRSLPSHRTPCAQTHTRVGVEGVPPPTTSVGEGDQRRSSAAKGKTSRSLRVAPRARRHTAVAAVAAQRLQQQHGSAAQQQQQQRLHTESSKSCTSQYLKTSAAPEKRQQGTEPNAHCAKAQ